MASGYGRGTHFLSPLFYLFSLKKFNLNRLFFYKELCAFVKSIENKKEMTFKRYKFSENKKMINQIDYKYLLYHALVTESTDLKIKINRLLSD